MKEDILKFYKEYEEIRFNNRKDVKRLIIDISDGLSFLEKCLIDWDSISTKIQQVTYETTPGQWDGPTEQVKLLLDSAITLLMVYENTKQTILLPILEDVQKSITKGVADLLKAVDGIFRLYEPINAKIDQPSLFLNLEVSAIKSNRTFLTQCRRQIESIKLKLQREKLSVPWKLSWNQLPSRGFQFLLFLLLLSTNWLLSPELLQNVKLITKLVILIIMIMWFPTNFVPAFLRSYRVTSFVLGAVIWSLGLSIWVYDLMTGFIVTIVLIAFPYYQLFQSSHVRERQQQLLVNSAYRKMTLALLLTGLILRENMWIIGAIAWWVYTFVSQLSFRYFRSTFDMVDAIDPKRNSADVKRNLVFFSLAATVVAVVLFSVLAGYLTKEFVLNVYSQAATISFGVVAILFAVQSIIPGITSWGGSEIQQRTPSQIREMKVLLSTSRGLMGFLQVFFILFLVALIGWGISSLVSSEQMLVNLSPQFLVMPNANVLDLISFPDDFNYSPEVTLIFVQTLFFVGFLSLFAFSLAVLYYLFIATNTLTLPIQDALISQPVYIDSKLQTRTEQNTLMMKLIARLQEARSLRGEYITDLQAYSNPSDVGATIWISGDFDSTAEIVDKAMNLLKAGFKVAELETVQVIVVKASIGPAEKQKLLSIQVTRAEFEKFLNVDIKGMDKEFMMIQLGAIIFRHFLPEAQIV